MVPRNRRAREITKSETRVPDNIGRSTNANTNSSAYATCQPALIIPITHASTTAVHEIHTYIRRKLLLILNIDLLNSQLTYVFSFFIGHKEDA